MSHIALALGILIFGQNILAEADSYKSWKVFRSNYSYEFKYPQCWSVKIDDADYEGKVEGSAYVIAQANDCGIKNSVEQSVGFQVDFPKLKTSELTKKIADRQKELEAGLKNGDILHFEKKTLGGSTTYSISAYSDPFKKKIFSKMIVFCRSSEITVSGPAISNASAENIQRIKQSGTALIEPAKTIYSSVRCLEKL